MAVRPVGTLITSGSGFGEQATTAQWVQQQARYFCIDVEEQGFSARYLIRDRDRKFTSMFDSIMKAEGIEMCPLPVRSPNLNAFIERFIQTLKIECLSRFVILGEKHSNYLTREFVDYYHRQRPHQSKENAPLIPSDTPPSKGDIVCEERLGGVITHYYRKAA